MGEPCAFFPRRLSLAALATLGGSSSAEGVLDLMEQQFLPRQSLYENVITYWCAETGMAARARQLLTHMEGMFVAHGYESIQPKYMTGTTGSIGLTARTATGYCQLTVCV